MSTPTIFYLHGFASAGNGPKAQALRSRFGPRSVLSPDLPIDPRAVRDEVDSLIRTARSSPLILVGTSLGGFYACYFSRRWSLPCVLVNPSMEPSRTVGKRIGTHRNYSTGADFEVTQEHAREWAAMEASLAEGLDARLVSLFLAQDDDVLPYTSALQRIPADAFRCVTPDGGHRYESHWGSVMDRIAAVAASLG
ncbi:hypothetical protein H8N03_06710 [Ramlibacter sp. USB13]|uniref:Esterase n=1 Tax=Ramlibacter cellulosilyticus TaxID=2764187 RepID=A0A923MNK5_9BURK|nr:YqiA/YcfP family alpha/beta fold hydrolase [Ramlibacter cellulosilyticus]MBC5782630.1 hypothetical protein [Ramlibacter cellulosilyticus]